MIVILHGWSDGASSFKPLAKHLMETLPGPVRAIHLGDYVSMDDDVTFDDLAEAMQRAWKAAGLPTAARSVDMVVHSTGALVARHWMTRYYAPDANPLHRFLMLAPANFGSPLAHKGTSFLGRVVKGYDSRRLFHTGKRILAGLEMASPFSWRLAEVDRFDAQKVWYGPGRVLATVLVGTHGYTGIAAAANAPGSDGTVYVSTANLNPARLTLDFATNPDAPTMQLRDCVGQTAFCRIPDDNHSTVAFKDKGPKNAVARELVQAALTVNDATFDAHVADLAVRNAEFRREEAGTPYTHGYQNTVLRVTDDHGCDVRDYFFEAFAKRPNGNGEDKPLTAAIQTEVLRTVHVNGTSSAFRSLLFDCDRLVDLLVERDRPLNVSITASPDVKDTKSVGYSTVGYDDIGSIRIAVSDLGRVFVPDRTLLASLELKRRQVEDLVTFTRV